MQGAGWRDESMRPWKLTWAIAVNPEEHCRFKVLIGTLQISIIPYYHQTTSRGADA
jgi:hypothetical protein